MGHVPVSGLDVELVSEVVLVIVERHDRRRPLLAADGRHDLHLQSLIALTDREQPATAAEEGIRRVFQTRIELE